MWQVTQSGGLLRPSHSAQLDARKRYAPHVPSTTVRVLSTLVAALLVGASITSCTTVNSSATGTISASGLQLEIDGASVTIPPGVAPDGSVARIADTSHDFGEMVTYATALRAPVVVTIGDGIQPTAPITISLRIDDSKVSTESWSSSSTFAFLSQPASGEEPELIPATWNDKQGTLTAEVAHLSWFQPIQFDLNALWKGARDSLMQGLGIESAQPDCVDKKATISGATYSAISPWGAWVCFAEDDGVVIELTSNAAIPFLVTSTPKVSAQSQPEFGVKGAASQAVFNLLFKSEGTLLAPGGSVMIEFGDKVPKSLQLEQYPAMLLLAILLTVVDVALPSSISQAVLLDKFAAAECLVKIANTAAVGTLSAKTAGALVQAFFSCASVALGDAGPTAKIVLAILSAAPAFFAGSVIGMINEFTGNGSMRVDIDRVGPKRTIPGLDASLNGKWCLRSDPTDCFDPSSYAKKFPRAFVYSVGADDDVSGATIYDICLEPDLDGTCSMAATMLLRYLPAGVAWDCDAIMVESGRWPGCALDYSEPHVSSLPRLVHMYNHQQDEVYHDPEPMYRSDK